MIQSSLMLGSLWLWEVKWMISQFGRDHWFVGSGHLSNCVWLFATPWTAASQASLSFTISQTLFKLISIESEMLSNHLVLCSSLLLLTSISPSIRVFVHESALHISGQSTRASTSASVSLRDTQGWSPLGLTGWISLQVKGLSRVFSSTTVQRHQFFSAQPSLWSNSHIRIWLLEKP